MSGPQRGGEMLARLRERNGLSVAELARRANVSATTIINYERGVRPSGDEFTPNPTVLLKVASAFSPQDAARLLASYGLEDRGAALVADDGVASTLGGRDYAVGSQFEYLGRAANDPRRLILRDPEGELITLLDERTS
jgi:transcriptional regulator with XRE-family HTH domain